MLPLPSSGLRSPSPSARCGRRSPCRGARRSSRRRADSLVADAPRRSSRGRPWQASRLIAPVLADSTRRTPDAVFLAADRGEPLERLARGEPPARRASAGSTRPSRAAAGCSWPARRSSRRADSLALRHVAGRAEPRHGRRGWRASRPARPALDRLHARDSAAATYRRAAERLPVRRRLAPAPRRGGHRRQRPARRALRTACARPLARERIALGRGRRARAAIGDLVGAPPASTPRSAPALTALRLRLGMSPDSAPRAAVRRELARRWSPRGGAPARSAGRDRAARQRLRPAHRRPRSSRWRARRGRRARAPGPSTATSGPSRPGSGTARTASTTPRRSPSSAATARPPFQFNLVRAPASLARRRRRTSAPARSCATARSPRPLGAARHRRSDYPRDTSAASSALFLLGDLAADDRADRAGPQPTTAGRRCAIPTSRFAPPAALPRRHGGAPHRRAARMSAPRVRRAGPALPAQRGGLGRGLLGRPRLGRRRRHRRRPRRWERAAAGDPGSYYTAVAARRLGRPSWTPSAAADSLRRRARRRGDGGARGPARPARPGRGGAARARRAGPDRGDRSPSGCSPSPTRSAAHGRASQAIQLARRALANGAPRGRPDVPAALSR